MFLCPTAFLSSPLPSPTPLSRLLRPSGRSLLKFYNMHSRVGSSRGVLGPYSWISNYWVLSKSLHRSEPQSASLRNGQHPPHSAAARTKGGPSCVTAANKV